MSDVVLLFSFLGPALTVSLYGMGLMCETYGPQVESAIGIKLPFGKGGSGDVEAAQPEPDELNARAGSYSPEQRERDRAEMQSIKAAP